MKKILILAAMLGLFSISAFAHEGEMTAEDRKKMAETHEKMAACLRSDRPMSECEEEMGKTCAFHAKGKKGKGGKQCPMHAKHGKKAEHHEEHHEEGQAEKESE